MPADYSGDRSMLVAKYRDIKSRYAARDERHAHVSAARRGDVDKLLPGLFPKNFPKQVTANVLDTAAQDLGELLGELPDITCQPLNATSMASKKSAAKRTKIAIDHVAYSRLQQQMYAGCDRFVTFGALPIVVEPDFDQMKPVFRVDNPVGAYYELDLFGRTTCYFKRWHESVGSLVAKFPELEYLIRYDDKQRRNAVLLGEKHSSDSTMLEVVKYYGPTKTCVFLPDRDGLTLVESPNPVGEVPVFIAELPRWDDEVRGRFDQMLWIQVARARMSLFSLEAAHKVINAPLDVPSSVGNIPFGPNAVVRNDSNRPISRIPLDIPREIFAENANLAQEERNAARYPEVRSGNIDASIITGQGVEALSAGVTGQIKALQDILQHTLEDMLCFGFKLDQALWPDVKKPIEGKADGAPFSEDYTPAKDINGNYKVTVSYGLAYGMDRQRGLIFALQLQGAGIVDKGSVLDQFAKAFGSNAEEIRRKLDIEQVDDGIKQAVFNMATLINPQAAQMGVDYKQILRQMGTFQKEREKGVPVAEALQKALEPSEEEKRAAQQQQEAQAAANPIAAAQQELAAADAPGPAGAVPVSPQGAASGDLRTLLAGLTAGGDVNSSVGVSRLQPT